MRRINTLLFALIIVINAYLLVMPLWPRAVYWWQDHHHAANSTAVLNKKLGRATPPANIPKENRLIVPSMHLDEQIFEGKDLSVLRSGPWRRPNTSTPDKGGNTVIVGHRYTYTNPRGTFYYLDKAALGDHIGIWWQGKQYLYTVTSKSEVKPNDVAVEAPTRDAQLTLYTCTPLWLPKDRLVIVAKLERII